MIRRSLIDKKSYVLAFFITLFVFSIGIYVGDSLNNQKINQLNSLNDDLRTATLTIQTQYNLVSQNPCSFINDSEIFSELLDVSLKTEFMENQLGPNNIKVKKIKSYYSTLMIQQWLFNEKIQEACPRNKGHDIIYIYSNEDDCPNCDAQGYILTNLRKDYLNLRIFSFDNNLNNSAILTLKKLFFNSVEKFPILIIDGEVHQGFLNRNELEDFLFKKERKVKINID